MIFDIKHLSSRPPLLFGSNTSHSTANKTTTLLCNFNPATSNHCKPTPTADSIPQRNSTQLNQNALLQITPANMSDRRASRQRKSRNKKKAKAAASAKANALGIVQKENRPFQFFELPRSVRDNIYELVLAGHRKHHVSRCNTTFSHRQDRPTYVDLQRRNGFLHYLSAMALVNRQAHQEFLEAFRRTVPLRIFHEVITSLPVRNLHPRYWDLIPNIVTLGPLAPRLSRLVIDVDLDFQDFAPSSAELVNEEMFCHGSTQNLLKEIWRCQPAKEIILRIRLQVDQDTKEDRCPHRISQPVTRSCLQWSKLFYMILNVLRHMPNLIRYSLQLDYFPVCPCWGDNSQFGFGQRTVDGEWSLHESAYLRHVNWKAQTKHMGYRELGRQWEYFYDRMEASDMWPFKRNGEREREEAEQARLAKQAERRARRRRKKKEEEEGDRNEGFRARRGLESPHKDHLILEDGESGNCICQTYCRRIRDFN